MIAAVLTWMLGWLLIWEVGTLLMGGWLIPPIGHPSVWEFGRRLLEWPLIPFRARLLRHSRTPCPHCRRWWALPALLGLDLLFWPWLLLVTLWEAHGWREWSAPAPNGSTDSSSADDPTAISEDELEPVPGTQDPSPPRSP